MADPRSVDAIEGEGSTLELARRGDREALGDLWRAHNHQLLRYFRARQASNADDLTQQVWLDVAHGLPTFDGDPEHFRRWLFTIAYRRMADGWRQSRRRHESVTDEPPDRSADEPANADGLEWAVATIRRLPATLADPVLLRVVADLDVSEIAEILGIAPGTVRVRIHRGLLRLRELLDPSHLHVTPEAISTMKGVS